MKNAFRVLVVVALAGWGCNKPKQDTEAVRRGVIEHVSKNAGLDVSGMDVQVSSVSFRQNEATALVSFRPKDAPPGNSMQMSYTLEAKGDLWVVKGKGSPSGGGMGGASPHGGDGGSLPSGHPPVAPGQGAPK